MRYMDSLKFIAKREGWFVNLLLLTVCMFIPAVGFIVLLGYLFEVFDALRRDPEHKSYPLFEFGKFVPYLTRGIWPFLVQMIIGLLVMIPIGFMYFLVIVVSIAGSKGGSGGGVIVAVAWIMYIVVVILMSILSAMLQWPASIYAGIRQKIDVKELIAFTKDFVRRNFKELLLSLLFVMVVATVLTWVGLLALCVGAYVATSFMLLAQHHLEFQLYELHLSRGGIPVEGKPTLSVEIVTPDTSSQAADDA